MARVDDFDAFYHATRRPLLHQTYALNGDVTCAAAALEHAYAQAWVRWRKVRKLPDPTAWVRIEAWERVARPPRRWRRRRAGPAPFRHGTHSRHRRDLEALRALPQSTRRVLVLHHLAELSVERMAWELGVSERSVASLLARAEQSWPQDASPIATALANVEDEVADVRLSRAPRLRRHGDRRHRLQTVGGLVTASALLLGGGLLVDDHPASVGPARLQTGAVQVPAANAEATGVRAGATDPSRSGSWRLPEEFLLDESALLATDEMRRLTQPRADWSVTSTTDGTTGDLLYATCQRAPFADPDGDQSLVRRYQAEAADGALSAVQVIEESRSEPQSAEAFEVMEGWYARCQEQGVHLLSTVAVQGLGDQARAFQLHESGRRDRYLTVGIARTGPIVTALVATTRGDEPVPMERVLERVSLSVMRMCLRVSGDCSTRPEPTRSAPLPAEENPGFLADFDLPVISGVRAPWVGTEPRRTPDNPGATACDRAQFGRGQRPRSRMFVLPTAEDVPTSFGVTQTVGTFRTAADARAFVRRVYASAESCADRELSASEPRMLDVPGEHQGRLWRFAFEVTKERSVTYRVAVVRAARRVAVLSMSPVAGYDVTQQQFAGLAVRASQRLAEAARAQRASDAATGDAADGQEPAADRAGVRERQHDRR